VDSRYSEAYEHYFNMRRSGGMSEDRFRLPPEAVALKIADALESPRPKIRYCVTVPAYIGFWAARLLPAGLIDRLMAAEVKKRFR
jgi:hypothetical protein